MAAGQGADILGDLSNRSSVHNLEYHLAPDIESWFSVNTHRPGII